MTADEEAFNSHAYASWYNVLSGLGEDEGRTAEDVALRQISVQDVNLKY
ncbi:predicted protein [Sclerotinia sclerotiorum 1980 UF-70]|uniref:Uncharacterized protein n=1 Tax=Sclerotinia sclerotiorum (strain ATCC 18683 / 1980 / Ss-1) TaxID=665079 RepID=A7EBT6_SCLS1|nr:predicted protein [Sclerotinia sclerotiorum 1980 UF-70]EDN99914.1 predicted protein [Sclerotinia sclerotiorum 1980 UF-70]